MVEMEIEPATTLTVCGDTHGQYFDLLEIFRLNGFPDEKHAYLFNGDFVDRGSWSTEIALLLYAYKWLRPKMFFLNRGNHETDDMNRVYGFEGECKAKYNERVFKVFSESFSALPLATLVGKKYLTLHGGLFSDDNTSLDDIRKLDRHVQRQPGQQGLMMEMLWTDPQPQNGRGPSKRGVGLQFGPDVTKRFCEKNGLEAVIRSHEVRMEGYEVEHGGKCVTGISYKPGDCQTTLLTTRQSSLHRNIAMRPRIREHTSISALTSNCSITNSTLSLILISSQWSVFLSIFTPYHLLNSSIGLCTELDNVDDVNKSFVEYHMATLGH